MLLALLIALQGFAVETIIAELDEKTPYQQCVESCQDAYNPGHQLRACVIQCEMYLQPQEEPLDPSKLKAK